MTHFYIKLILPIAFACLIFTLITRAIGTTQPPNPALRGFTEGCEGKSQPCWYGIVPGMDVQKVRPIIENLGYVLEREPNPGSPFVYHSTQLAPSCIHLWYYEYPGTRMSTLTLSCLNINMAEAISFFGSPDYIEHNEIYGKSINYPSFSMAVKDVWFTPSTNISSLSILSQNRVYSNNILQIRWQGFNTLAYYCQSQSDYIGCQ